MCDYSLLHFNSRLAEEKEVLTAAQPGSSVGLFSGEDYRTAVCIPPGTTLLIEKIPTSIQKELGLDGIERATFDQFDVVENRHRDGVRFANGKQILLQRLKGVRVTVLSLTGNERQPAPAETHTHTAR